MDISNQTMMEDEEEALEEVVIESQTTKHELSAEELFQRQVKFFDHLEKLKEQHEHCTLKRDEVSEQLKPALIKVGQLQFSLECGYSQLSTQTEMLGLENLIERKESLINSIRDCKHEWSLLVARFRELEEDRKNFDGIVWNEKINEEMKETKRAIDEIKLKAKTIKLKKSKLVKHPSIDWSNLKKVTSRKQFEGKPSVSTFQNILATAKSKNDKVKTFIASYRQ